MNKYADKRPAPPPAPEMHVVKVISEHRKRHRDVAPGGKRVEAIVRFGRSKRLFTRHIDIEK